MFDIASGIDKLKARWDRAAEARRLIDREKLMIDPTSIVLYGDFLTKAVEPAIASHDSFKRVFYNGAGILNAINNMTMVGMSPMFPVRFRDIDEGVTKNRAMGSIIDAVEQIETELKEQEKASMAFVQSIFGDDVEMLSIADVFPEEAERARQQTIDLYKEQTVLPAFYVQDIVQAMDLHRGFMGSIGTTRYETTAQLKDEGMHAVDFWKAINNLRDYSGLFPNKPPPRGNDSDRNRETRLGGLVGQHPSLVPILVRP